MVKPGPKTQLRQLLRLWKDQEDQEKFTSLPFQEIVEKAQKKPYNLQKRTVINYLNWLVENKDLEKQVDSNRKTYYKPSNDTVVFREIAKNCIEEIEMPELVAFLSYFLMNLAVSEDGIGSSIESLDVTIEEAKRGALAIIHAKKQLNDAAKELGLDTSPGGVTT
jgi:predicted transcriptional regulator